jgi:hypothetical protein
MSIGVAEPTSTISKLTVRSTSPTAAHVHHATHVSSDAIALGALGALVVLACLVWALARVLALEPRWALSLRHSFGEARFRVSATLSEFGDWLRLGH